MFQLESIAKRYGGEALFSTLSWQIPKGETIGLVGPNGAGKTTLFRLLAGEEEPDDGRVVRPRDTRVGHLPQEIPAGTDGTVLDVVLDGRPDLLELERRVKSLQDQMSRDGADEEVAAEFANLEDRFRREGGYELRNTAREIAAGVGFEDEELDRPVETFSGGWRMRALLARLLFSRPDLLLLDEPTNHLDVDSIEWLEQYLADYAGTVITISHDRFFLNRVVDGIAELHGGTIGVYHGDYDHYLVERQRRRQKLLDKRQRQQQEQKRLQEFIDKFRYNAARASQVQSRIKRLEKMELVDVPPAYNKEIGFEFPSPPRVGKTVIDVQEVAKRFGDHVVYDGVDFKLRRGDRVAFVGPNGAGKSTLLKMIGGQLTPDEGSVEYGHRVEVAYFAQHSVDQLDTTHTVLEEMHAAASYDSAPKVRSILGAFLFSGDDVHKSISVLSGGEKSRLALAKMMLEPAGCLLLDEPTNHLDIPSRRILEHALRHFEGAFCVISHDRYFLNEVVNRVVHIEDGELDDFPGTYEEYRWRRQQGAGQSKDESMGETTGDSADEQPLSRKERRRLRAKLRREKNAQTRELREQVAALEDRVATLEAELAEVEEVLAKPETHQGEGSRIASLQKRHGELEAQLMETMSQWEEKGGRLEEIEKKFAAREAAIDS